MADVVQSIRELPTWVKLLVALGVGMFVLIPLLVVLAAVVGAFVLNVGGGAELAEAPQVEFVTSYDEAAGELTITHEAGDAFDSGTVTLDVDGEQRPWPGSGTVTQGDQVTLSDVQPGTTVRVVWRGSDGASTVLLRYEA
ncbi:type IV pilin [Haloarchaeobius iranensis]|uniref:Archaeal Type IV pilin N-terminal domain-containing protein n=1 Tax=Haloarchaeobius iranensis TaxID=996166 RepID=A0A1G9UKB1_9EURY|nr:type IV pilin N-terminal domain-containing protein [Haloarchaeobius iranensis]SDM60293.1 Protein of unknown function [Haloarchaeobius iranensis]